MILYGCVLAFLILMIRSIYNSDVRWRVIATMSSNDESCDSDCPPKKKRSNESRSSNSSSTINKRKFAGAAKSKTKFKPSQTKKWPSVELELLVQSSNSNARYDAKQLAEVIRVNLMFFSIWREQSTRRECIIFKVTLFMQLQGRK